MITIALIGAGHMAHALAAGLADLPDFELTASHPREGVRSKWRQKFNFEIIADNTTAATRRDVVILCVPPAKISEVAREIATTVENALVVSVAAGITLGKLSAWLPAARVVRAMPNQGVAYCAGATGLVAHSTATTEDIDTVCKVFGAVGIVEVFERESDLNIVTALSGSGPAFVFYTAKAMAEAAADLGLDPQAAVRLAVQTVHGAGTLLTHRGAQTLQELMDSVTSRGGTTAAGLNALDEQNADKALAEALAKAAQRAAEIAAEG